MLVIITKYINVKCITAAKWMYGMNYNSKEKYLLYTHLLCTRLLCTRFVVGKYFSISSTKIFFIVRGI